MIDKNPVLSVVNGKMCINGKTFEHTELNKFSNQISFEKDFCIKISPLNFFALVCKLEL